MNRPLVLLIVLLLFPMLTMAEQWFTVVELLQQLGNAANVSK